MSLISDAGVLFDQHTVNRHINSTYLRFIAKIVPVRSVPVSKTYRHLRFGGITSRAGIIGQKHYVPEPELPHVFDRVIV